MRSTHAAPPWPPPAMTSIPAAAAAPTVDAMSAASDDRAFAVTRVISAGSSRGAIALRVTPKAFCSTRTPNAAGSRLAESWCCTATAMPQQSRPRASRLPARMNRRPCCTLSSIGPISGASTANGAMVITSASATRPRAWSTEALKNKVPASAMATNASARLLAAVSSMSLLSPVREAPDAPVSRCTTRLAPPAAEAPARAAVCEAETTERVARLARSLVLVPGSRIAQVFCLARTGTTPPDRRVARSPRLSMRTCLPIRNNH